MPFTISSPIKLSSKRRGLSQAYPEPPTPLTDPPRSLERAASRAAEIGWQGAKALLYLLRDSADAFPPLKSAAGGIVALVELGERLRSTSEGVIEATEWLNSAMEILAQRLKHDSAPNFSNRPYMALLVTELQKLESMSQKGLLARLAQNRQLEEQLKGIFNTLAKLMQELQLEIGLSVERDTRAILQESVLQNLGRAKSSAHTAAVYPSHGPRRCCTPGTRTAIVNDVISWGLKEESKAYGGILGITGLAGQGKTTVAYTVCERLENLKRAKDPTVISFFCSRQLDSHEEKLLVSTLAFELAEASASYASELVYALQAEHNLGDQRLSVQMSQLLVGPWDRSVDARRHLPPIILVIDAIDENDAGMEFVGRLVSAKANGKLLGLRVLLTSRPDPAFDSALSWWNTRCDLNGRVYQNQALPEILIYLRAELPEHRDEDYLEAVARASGGLFIYAATIVRLVKSKGGRRTRSEQAAKLRRLIGYAPTDPEVELSTSSSTHVTILDALYAGVLQEMFSDLDEEEITTRLYVLMTLVCTSHVLTMTLLASLAGVDEELVDAVVQALHAVLYVDVDKHVLLCHSSFQDFILGKYTEFIPLIRKRVLDRCQEQLSPFAESGTGGSMASTSAPIPSNPSYPTKAQVDSELLRTRIALMEAERVVHATHTQRGSSAADTS